MRAGSLRHRVAIEQYLVGSPTQNAGGEEDGAWTNVATVYAAVEPLSGRELIAAQQTSAEVTGKIRIRYRAGVTAAMRAVFGTRYYDILAVIDAEERHREMVLLTKEGVSANG